MTSLAPRLLSTAFGLLMAAVAAVYADGIGLVVVTLAVIAVLVGLQFHFAATLSVLLTVAALVLSDPPPLFAAVSGLSAAAYLVLRHAVGAVMMTRPTMLGMLGFTVVGIAATAVPLQLPWLPLLAPPAVLAIFALATLPFFSERHPWTT